MGIGMGGNGNCFSGINGNEIEISRVSMTGNENGNQKTREWEGMGCQKLFPHISHYTVSHKKHQNCFGNIFYET